MDYEIPSDLKSFVDQQIELGCLPSEEHLVAEALRRLKAERDETLAGIRQGLDDAASDRVQPVAEAFADVRREFALRDPA